MKKIKVFWNINELANWESVFDQQLECIKSSGLMAAADDIILMGNGRPQTFTNLIDKHTESPKLGLVIVSDSASLFEYPGLTFVQQQAKEAEEPFHICYIHLKGLTRWGNPNVEDWKAWLNWCVIERWKDNVAALQTHDTSGPNWDSEPWPHYSSNFWWANSDYISKLIPLVHPHKLVSHNATQFKPHPEVKHWRFDHEAWIGTGNPTAFEIARSLKEGDNHYVNPYPRELYRND
jgi:hypothetical protein